MFFGFSSGLAMDFVDVDFGEEPVQVLPPPDPPRGPPRLHATPQPSCHPLPLPPRVLLVGVVRRLRSEAVGQ